MEEFRVKTFFLYAMAVFLIGVGFYAGAAKGLDPDADLEAYKDYFKTRFPKMKPEDYSLKMYNFNEDKRAQREEIMEFPPYRDDSGRGSGAV